MKKKTWDISVKDNPNRLVMGENDEFYTTDTNAFLIFKLDDKNFNPTSAVLSLENRNDDSFVIETVNVVNGLIVWEMPQRYIERFGNWRGQLIYEDAKNGQPEFYTSATFSFVVKAHISDKKKPSIVTWADMEGLRQANELHRQQAELDRQETYEKVKDLPESFQNVIDETTGKDVISAPEIIAARKGKASLGAKIDEVDAQLAQKVGGGKLATLNDLDEETLNFIHDGTGGPIQIESVPKDNSVTPQKTTFFEPPKNLFSGEYVNGGLAVTSGMMRYSLINTLSDSIAIIPIEANETYTVKIHDVGLSNKLNIGILNAEPEQASSYQEVDTLVFYSFSEKSHTFTNTSEGRYLLISVSSGGLKPRLQVEQGTEATEYIDHPKIDDKYINFKDDDIDGIVADYEAEKESTGLITTPTEKAKIIPLMSGENSDITVTGGTFQVDNSIKKGAESGVRFSITSTSGTPYLQRLVSDNSLTGIMAVGMWLHINDVSKINTLFLNVADENNVSINLSSITLEGNGIFIKEGWNLLRFRMHVNAYEESNFGRITRVRVFASVNEPTEITVGSVWAEKFEKAKLLFIHDGGYSDFFQKDGRGYEDLKARGIPCTIAAIPYNIGNPDNVRFISKSKLYELSLENNNDVSIHSYAGQNEIATMTPEELREESFNAIDMLRGWGYNPLWRAAWFRNTAPSAMGSTGLFHAFAFSTAFSMIERIESFPFENRYNVSRIQIHWRERAHIDRYFDVLKSTKGVMVAYTHSVADDSSGDISESEWDYFLSKVDEGLNEGWLEGTTFKMLIEPYVNELNPQ